MLYADEKVAEAPPEDSPVHNWYRVVFTGEFLFFLDHREKRVVFVRKPLNFLIVVEFF